MPPRVVSAFIEEYVASRPVGTDHPALVAEVAISTQDFLEHDPRRRQCRVPADLLDELGVPDVEESRRRRRARRRGPGLARAAPRTDRRAVCRVGLPVRDAARGGDRPHPLDRSARLRRRQCDGPLGAGRDPRSGGRRPASTATAPRRARARAWPRRCRSPSGPRARMLASSAASRFDPEGRDRASTRAPGQASAKARKAPHGAAGRRPRRRRRRGPGPRTAWMVGASGI